MLYGDSRLHDKLYTTFTAAEFKQTSKKIKTEEQIDDHEHIDNGFAGEVLLLPNRNHEN